MLESLKRSSLGAGALQQPSAFLEGKADPEETEAAHAGSEMPGKKGKVRRMLQPPPAGWALGSSTSLNSQSFSGTEGTTSSLGLLPGYEGFICPCTPYSSLRNSFFLTPLAGSCACNQGPAVEGSCAREHLHTAAHGHPVPLAVTKLLQALCVLRPSGLPAFNRPNPCTQGQRGHSGEAGYSH